MDQFFRRDLPHFHPNGATFFVTFRLSGSLPRFVLDQLRAEKARLEQRIIGLDDKARSSALRDHRRRAFALHEKELDRASTGPQWLKDRNVATCVVETLRKDDGRTWELDAYCIMSNHVHLVFRTLRIEAKGKLSALSTAMKLIKGRSSIQCNRILQRSGSFWESESYDHVVRSEDEWLRIIKYTLMNPVKVGLIDDWRRWPWTYCRAGIVS